MHKQTNAERRAILLDAHAARMRGDHALAALMFSLVGISYLGGGK